MSNSIESYPTKIFEYMAVGLPIVSSNFPLYNSVINKNECGITVNPKSAADIANAIIEIATNKELRSTMELKGKKAVLQQYSWQNELPHLTKFYSDILA